MLYFFPGLSFILFCSFLLIYSGLGVGVLGLGSCFGLVGLGSLADGVGARGAGPSGVFVDGALYINIKE